MDGFWIIPTHVSWARCLELYGGNMMDDELYKDAVKRLFNLPRLRWEDFSDE